MLPRVKKMWDEYRHMNYLKLNGGVDPCAAIRARLAEVEAQRDGLKTHLQTLRKLCGYVENGTDTAIAFGQDDATKTWSIWYTAMPYKTIAWGNTFEEMLLNAREALAKLEEK